MGCGLWVDVVVVVVVVVVGGGGGGGGGGRGRGRGGCCCWCCFACWGLFWAVLETIPVGPNQAYVELPLSGPNRH